MSHKFWTFLRIASELRIIFIRIGKSLSTISMFGQSSKNWLDTSIPQHSLFYRILSFLKKETKIFLRLLENIYLLLRNRLNVLSEIVAKPLKEAQGQIPFKQCFWWAWIGVLREFHALVENIFGNDNFIKEIKL